MNLSMKFYGFMGVQVYVFMVCRFLLLSRHISPIRVATIEPIYLYFWRMLLWLQMSS